MGRVVSEDELIEELERFRRTGTRTVVFTNGCFDLLHPGHVHSLEAARSLGDALVVAINTDRSVRHLKGPGRPLIPEQERAEVLAALEAVSWVVLFDDPTPLRLILRVAPEILVKGADWPLEEVVGRAEVEARGGRVVSIPLEPGYSTTALIARIRQHHDDSSAGR